jgi:hypothetical protein
MSLLIDTGYKKQNEKKNTTLSDQFQNQIPKIVGRGKIDNHKNTNTLFLYSNNRNKTLVYKFPIDVSVL